MQVQAVKISPTKQFSDFQMFLEPIEFGRLRVYSWRILLFLSSFKASKKRCTDWVEDSGNAEKSTHAARDVKELLCTNYQT